MISRRKKAGSNRQAESTSVGVFRRPTLTSLVWASLDLITVLIAGVLALRAHVALPAEVPPYSVVPHLFQASPRLLFFYFCWFAVCIIFFTRSYGLYGPIQNRS